MPSNTQTFAVQGMTCTSCAHKVTEAVEAVAGVGLANVDIRTGTLTVNADAPTSQVREAIVAAGYQVV